MNREKVKNLFTKLTLFLTSFLVVIIWRGRMFKSAGKVIPEGLKNLQLGLILLTMLDLLILTYLDRKKNTLYLIIFYLIMGLVFYAFKRAGRI